MVVTLSMLGPAAPPEHIAKRVQRLPGLTARESRNLPLDTTTRTRGWRRALFATGVDLSVIIRPDRATRTSPAGVLGQSHLQLIDKLA